MTIQTFFNRLSGYDITGTINDGVMSFNSLNGNYLEAGGIVNKLGISTNVDSTMTTGCTQTSAMQVNYESVLVSGGGTETTSVEQTVTIWTTTTTSTTQTETIWTTSTIPTTQTVTIWTTTTTSTTQTDTIWVTNTVPTTETVTIGTSQTSTAPITYTTYGTIYADESSRISDFVELAYEDYGDGLELDDFYNVLYMYDTLGVSHNYFIDEESTFGDLIDAMGSVGISATMIDGRIHFTSTNGAYILANDDEALFEYIDYKLGFTENIVVGSVTVTQGTQGTVAKQTGFINNTFTSVSTTGLFEMATVDASSTLASGTYLIDSTSDLKKLATLANNAKLRSNYSYKFVLRRDLDLSELNEDRTPIGDYHNNNAIFRGVFEGNGHTISNISIASAATSANGYYGLFGCCSTATIQNVATEGVFIDTNGSTKSVSAGGIVAHSLSHCYINNCGVSSATINASSSASGHVGGIVGNGESNISKCYVNDSNLSSNSSSSDYFSYSGGIVGAVSGSFSSNFNVLNCNVYNCDISSINNVEPSQAHSAGIAGGGVTGANIANCSVDIRSGSACHSIINDFVRDGSRLSCSNNIYSANAAQGRSNTISYNLLGNSDSNTFVREGTGQININENTSLGQLNLTSNATISYHDSEGEHSETFYTSDTLDTIKTWLTDAGFGWDLSRGVLTLTGAEELYITAFDNNLANALNLNTNWTTTNTINDFITTTVSSTNTTTIYTTTTTSSTETQETFETVTTSSTSTSTLWTTTTSSSTNTETIWSTITHPSTYTTTTLTMSESSEFSLLGLSGNAYITVHSSGSDSVITLNSSNTVGNLITELSNKSITASVTDGKLSLSPASSEVYITGISNNLRNILNLDSNYYTKNYSYSNSDSNSLAISTTHNIERTTLLSEAKVRNSSFSIHNADGSYSTISTAGMITFDDLITTLSGYGITMEISDGNVVSKADGNVYLVAGSCNLLNVLNLNNIDYDYREVYQSKGAGIVTYDTIIEHANAAPEEVSMQVGIFSNDNSRINVKFGLEWELLNSLNRIGIDLETDFQSRIDKMLDYVRLKQTELGAAECRLLSALEEIGMKYDNLVSTKSIISDADISEVSSEFIRNQILRQASLTLMSTANQSPAIVLSLI